MRPFGSTLQKEAAVMSTTLKRPRKAALFGGLLCIAAIAAFFLQPKAGQGGSEATPLTFAALKGPLTISVSEAGTIKSRNLEVIKSELEGQTTILFLVPEGTQVNKGDLLVELDASKLQDQRVDKQITEQNAEANFIRARESLEVAKNQAQADIAKAELEYQFAKEDLEKYEKGDYPMAVKEAEAKHSLALNELMRAEEKLKQSRDLYALSFTSLSEVQADELTQKLHVAVGGAGRRIDAEARGPRSRGCQGAAQTAEGIHLQAPDH
jgi:HlyD family secretion protein